MKEKLLEIKHGDLYLRLPDTLEDIDEALFYLKTKKEMIT